MKVPYVSYYVPLTKTSKLIVGDQISINRSEDSTPSDYASSRISDKVSFAQTTVNAVLDAASSSKLITGLPVLINSAESVLKPAVNYF